MIAIDCRSLQDDSRFRGIGTVIRSIIQHLPNRDQYVLFGEAGKDFNSYGIEKILFRPPSQKKNYGIKLAQFLQSCHVKHFHFMAQYNIPDHFDFPYSVTVHDLFNEYLLTNKKKYQQVLFPMVQKLKKAKHIIAISEYTKRMIEEQFNQPKVSVVYNGFNSTILEDSKTNIELETLSITEPYILYMGNFETRKNFLGAIRGFLEFRKKNPSYQLVACTGHQPLILPPTIWWLLIKNKRNIKLKSFIDSIELANIYNKASALLFPSFAEGFGLPILEAMSVQTLAVTSNTTSLPEVGKDAVAYVDPNNPIDISRGLDSVINDQQLQRELLSKIPSTLNSFQILEQAKMYDIKLNEILNINHFQ